MLTVVAKDFRERQLPAESAAEPADVLPQAPRLHRFELLLIFGFWAVVAVLVSLNATLNPMALPPNHGSPVPPALGAIAECVVWAVLTPFVFWMVRRYTLDHPRWPLRLLGFMGIGGVVALAVFGLMQIVRVEGRGFFNLIAGVGPPVPPGQPSDVISRLWIFSEFAVFMFLVAAGVANDYFLRYRRSRQRAEGLKLQLVRDRLSALQAQLNPHFLFNTLNGVSSLIERDPQRAQDMIADLSQLLRETLTRDQLEVPLEDELRLIRRYLSIMQARFGGRLQFREQIDESARGALVPTLILQPLVENAIKHGIESTGDAAQVRISATRAGNDLVLSVENDGALRAPGGPARGTGIGLRNTRERLAHAYGRRQALSLTERLPGRVQAEVRLPFHTCAPG